MKKIFTAFMIFALAYGATTPLQAEPIAPQKRSFRPLRPVAKHVPIKQNVSGGKDQMKQALLTVTIPPPPIPDAEEITIPAEEPTEQTPFYGPAPGADAVPSNADIPPVPEFNEEVLTMEEPVEPGVDTPPSPDTVSTEGTAPPAAEDDEPEATLSLANLRREAHLLAQQGLKYSFGADDPKTGGLDCSGVVQHLLTKLGVEDVPRTSYDQYYWLKRKKLLDDVYGKGSTKKLFKKLSPGDLIFWGGTWDSGHRVSHVMIYMGYNPDEDKHYVFGARSKTSEGMFGNGVDIFELDAERGRLIAHGKIPGLQY